MGAPRAGYAFSVSRDSSIATPDSPAKIAALAAVAGIEISIGSKRLTPPAGASTAAKVAAARAQLAAIAAANALRSRLKSTAALSYDTAAWTSLTRSLDGITAIIALQLEDEGAVDCAAISASIAQDLSQIAPLVS